MDEKTQLLHDISAIYKFIYQNQGTHRNILRKKLLQSQIPSQKRFSTAFQFLIDSGKISMERELVTLSTSHITTGRLQKYDDEYVAVIPQLKKKLPISKSIASGYNVGDLIDMVIADKGTSVITVLGKYKNQTKEQPDKQVDKKTTSGANKMNETTILGRVIKLSHDELIFIPNKKSLPARQIPILNSKDETPAFQDKICTMKLVNDEAPLLGGYITAIKGDAGNPIHEYDAIAENYGAIMSWEGEKIEAEIDKIPTSVDTKSLPLIPVEQAKTLQKNHVVDLRHIPFVTVDPATCKDMDDAIYSTFNENGDIVCYTAVANATKYFNLYSEIGRRYTQGAFTIYAPNKAYNILPTKLSTGLCSLNPNEPKLAFVVKTTIDGRTGKAKESTIYDALIESRKKYSYEQAQDITDRLKNEATREFLMEKIASNQELSEDEQVLMNYYSAQTIKKEFENRQMIRFVSNAEREVIFDSNHEDITDIITLPHLYYHEVIEAFMITANEATAKFTRDHNIPNIYRVHDKPRKNKMERASEFFKILGVDFDGSLSASSTRAIIDSIKESPTEEPVNQFLIKMQSRAVYSDSLHSGASLNAEENWIGEPISHYALQSPHYSHSTSIIRRLPDYITHYNILAYMHDTKPISTDSIKKIVEVANARQLQVDQAEKDFEDISSVIYCEKHIGEKMDGMVTKIRYASQAEGYEDDIIVIVKNPEKGISVEIPLSQIIGKTASECTISSEHCAVYNKRGDVVLTICKPINFYIDRADRKTMVVVGRTNAELVKTAEENPPEYLAKQNNSLNRYHGEQHHKQNKTNRKRRIENNKSHQQKDLDDEFEQ